MKTINTAFPLLGFWDTRQGGRSENQDSCGFIDTPYGMLAIVCDGMGGGPAGKQASVLAVQIIADYICKAPKGKNISELLKSAVEHANMAIISKGEEKSDLRGMGSTVIAILFNEEAAIVANVGDSRGYQFRYGSKVFRTEDHSVVADMVRSKALTEEQARLSEQANLITKALGRRIPNLVDITILPYEKGDRFLLCTDGIWGAMTEKELVTKVTKTPSLAGTVDSIVIQVDENGKKAGNKHDNLTLALFETKEDSKKKTKMNRKAIRIIFALTALCIISILLNIGMLIRAMRPNPEKELLKQSELRIAEFEEKNSLLKDKVDSLNHELTEANNKVVEAKNEAAEAKNEVAEAKNEAANIKKEYAERERLEAEKRQESLKRDKDNKNSKTQNKYNQKIDQVIEKLKSASNAKKDNQVKYIKDATTKLKELKTTDTTNAKTYDVIINELNKAAQNQREEERKKIIKDQITKLSNIK